MRQLTGDARFIDEHPDELAVLGDVRQDALDGDDLIDAGRAGWQCLEDLRHAADADALEQQVFPEGGDASFGLRSRFSHSLGSHKYEAD